MKKANLIVSLLIAVLFVTGCSNKENKESASRLQYEDFSLYDHDGREIDFLTANNDSINIHAYDDEADSVQTYREVRIGDRATTALSKYNLSDFKWDIKTSYIIGGDEEKILASKLNRKFKDYSSQEMLDYIPEITATENLQIIFSCSVYEYEGNYCLLDELYEEHVDPTSLLSYRIAIYVESEKIEGFVLSVDNIAQ